VRPRSGSVSKHAAGCRLRRRRWRDPDRLHPHAHAHAGSGRPHRRRHRLADREPQRVRPTQPPAGPAYRDAVDHFALRYPPAWANRTCPAGGHTGLYLAPTSAGLGVCNSGFTGQMSVAAVAGDQRLAYGLSGSDLITTAVTVGGVTGARQSALRPHRTLARRPAPARWSTCFFTGGLTYRCSYSQAPDRPDRDRCADGVRPRGRYAQFRLKVLAVHSGP